MSYQTENYVCVSLYTVSALTWRRIELITQQGFPQLLLRHINLTLLFIRIYSVNRQIITPPVFLSNRLKIFIINKFFNKNPNRK